MSVTRQQRRAMKRKLLGVSNEQAEKMVLAVRENTSAKRQAAKDEVPAITAQVTERIKRDWEPRIRAQACADTLIMVLAFEHIDRGHTGKWIAKWIHDFNEFGDAVNDSGEGMQALIDILKNECGLDIKKEFALCEIESNERAKEKRKRA